MLRDGSPTPTPTPTITPKKNNTHPQSIHHGGTRELRAVDVDDAGVRRAELVHEYVSNYGDPCWYIP